MRRFLWRSGLFPHFGFLFRVDSVFYQHSDRCYFLQLVGGQLAACLDLVSRLDLWQFFGRLRLKSPGCLLWAPEIPSCSSLQPLLRKKSNNRFAPAQPAIGRCSRCPPARDKAQVPAHRPNPCPSGIVEWPRSASLTLRETETTAEPFPA